MSTLATVSNWFRRRQLRATHKDTLARYAEQKFDPVGKSIGVGDALDQGILEPDSLHGYSLLCVAPTLDERVWTAWDEHSKLRLDLYKEIYGADTRGLETRFSSEYAKLLNYEALVGQAAELGKLKCIQWVHQLEKPWRPIDWLPAKLIGTHAEVGNWALDTFPDLKLTKHQSIALAKYLLWDDQNPKRYNHGIEWLRSVDNSLFTQLGWTDTRPEQLEKRLYATRLLDTLMPPNEWDWQRRWNVIGKDMNNVAEQSTTKAHRRAMNCQGTMLAALLHEAPQEIQMLLCGFKGAMHPDEPVHGNPDAQFVRQHFYNAKPPRTAPSPILAAVFTCVSGFDPDVEVNFVLEQMLRDGSTPVESYSLDGLDL